MIFESCTSIVKSHLRYFRLHNIVFIHRNQETKLLYIVISRRRYIE